MANQLVKIVCLACGAPLPEDGKLRCEYCGTGHVMRFDRRITPVDPQTGMGNVVNVPTLGIATAGTATAYIHQGVMSFGTVVTG